MRKQIVNKAFTVVLLLIICAVAMIGCQKKPAGEEKKPSTKVQLLSFDSYDEIAGTKIALENQFGRIEVNKDKAYITEGTGSMKVQPQGNYTNPLAAPYVEFDCVESTVKTSDFSNFRKVSFDVYNNMDEELHVILTLRASGTVSFPTQKYTLKANGWTTCTYQIEGNMPDGYAYLKDMRYIRLTFPEFKTDKDDTVNEFYIDNLVAESYEEPLNVTDKGYDFYEGVTFEDSREQCLVVGGGGASFQRVNYEEDGMEAPEELGEWGMKGNATGTTWPAFLFNYGEVVPAGTVLKFWTYVQVDNPVEARGNLVMETSSGKMYVTNKDFNTWFEVTVVLSAEAESSKVMFNFDSNYADDVGTSFFGDKEVNIWVDNVTLLTEWEAPDEVVVGDDGVVTLYNPTGDTTRQYDVKVPAKKGQVISFDIDFNSDAKVGIWVLAEGKWNKWDGDKLKEYNEFKAGYYEPWTGKQTIACVVDRDIEFFTICVSYSGANVAGRVCTISNIKVGEKVPEVTIKDDVITIKNEILGDSTRQYDVQIAAKKGQVISFDIDFNSDAKVGIWVLAEGKWNQWDGDKLKEYNEFKAGWYEPWSGKQTIACVADRDIEYFSIIVSYTGANLKGRVCTISNIQVGNKVPEATVKDGVVTIKNEILGDTSRQYDVKMSAKAGQIISFDIDFNAEDKVGIWVLANGNWNQWKGETLTEYNEFKAAWYETWTGKKTITCQVPRDIESFTIAISYTGKNLKARVCTISNIEVKDKDQEVTIVDGIVTIKNELLGDTSRQYDVKKSVKADQVISFDIDFNTEDKVGIWVLANGKWNQWEGETLTEYNEFKAGYYEPWTGKQTITCVAPRDIEYFTIAISYSGDNLKERICTISNIEVKDKQPAVVEKDGVVTLNNPLGETQLKYEVQKAVKNGEVISFDIDFNAEDKVGVFVLADGKWNKWDGSTMTEKNEFVSVYYESWDGVKHIKCTATKDIEYFAICVDYTGANLKDRVCTISNIEILSMEPFEALDFEEAKHIMNVSTASGCILTRLPYADASVTKKDDSFGDYGLKMETNGALYPRIDVNFGKVYDTEVTISFDVFVEVEAAKVKKNQFIYEVGGSWARSDLKFNQWESVTIKLPANMSSTRLMANLEHFGSVASGTIVNIYVDNVRLVLPPQSRDNITFEDATDMDYVSSPWPIGRQTTEGLSAVAGTDSHGDYVLKLEAGASLYPKLTVEFMKTYNKEVTISFDMYVEADAAKVKKNQFILEADGLGWIRSDFKFNQWETVTKKLPAGKSSIKFIANLEHFASLQSGATTNIYFDNIQIKEVSE